MRRMKSHFLTLDGLRGVAALAVLLFHRRWYAPGGHFLDHAYLAVDFFFGLSGFVIAHAYEGRIVSRSMSFADFVLVRAIRLYPMLILSGFLGGVVWIILGHSEPDVLIATVCAMFGLPTPFPASVAEGSGETPFPINSPTWSLFFEMTINVVYALIAKFLTSRLLGTIVVGTLLWLVYAAISQSTLGHLGVYYNLFWGGIPRTAFSFFMGVAIYRMATMGHLPAIRLPALGLALLLLLVFIPPSNAGPKNVYYDLTCVILVFPVIIILGCKNAPSDRLSTTAYLSGALSYPIYLLHYPFYAWYEQLMPLPRRSSLLVATLFVPLLSYLILVCYDEPVRAFLAKRRRGSRIELHKGNLEIDQ